MCVHKNVYLVVSIFKKYVFTTISVSIFNIFILYTDIGCIVHVV